MKKFERVKAVVSLDAIAHNFEEMKKYTGVVEARNFEVFRERPMVMDMVQKRFRVL